MTASKAKEIAIRYTEGVWNSKAKGLVRELVHNNALIHSPLGDFYGPQAMERIVETWLKAFPDLRLTYDYVAAEGDMVAVGWHVKATQWGEFKEMKPTGKTVDFSGVSIYRIQGGQIVEYWAYMDMHNLIKALSA